MTTDDLLQEGIAALKAGHKTVARNLLTQVVQQDDRNEMAWLWLSGAVDTDEDRRACLENVLAINPNNGIARRGLEQLIAKEGMRSLSVMSSLTSSVEPVATPRGQPTQPKPQTQPLRKTQSHIVVALALLVVLCVACFLFYTLFLPALDAVYDNTVATATAQAEAMTVPPTATTPPTATPIPMLDVTEEMVTEEVMAYLAQLYPLLVEKADRYTEMEAFRASVDMDRVRTSPSYQDATEVEWTMFIIEDRMVNTKIAGLTPPKPIDDVHWLLVSGLDHEARAYACVNMDYAGWGPETGSLFSWPEDGLSWLERADIELELAQRDLERAFDVLEQLVEIAGLEPPPSWR